MSPSELIAMVRDIAFISSLLVGPLLALIVYRKVSATIRAARRTTTHAAEIVSALSQSFVKPAVGGSGATFGTGKLMALARRGWRRRKGRKGASANG